MRRRKLSTHPAGVTMRIGDKAVNIVDARMFYRCAVCLSVLKYHNNSVACTIDPTHKGFVHRDEGARQADQIAKSLAEIEEQIWKIH